MRNCAYTCRTIKVMLRDLADTRNNGSFKCKYMQVQERFICPLPAGKIHIHYTCTSESLTSVTRT